MSAVDVVKTGTPHVQYGAWLTSAQTRQRERPDQRYSGWALVCWALVCWVEMGESRKP